MTYKKKQPFFMLITLSKKHNTEYYMIGNMHVSLKVADIIISVVAKKQD